MRAGDRVACQGSPRRMHGRKTRMASSACQNNRVTRHYGPVRSYHAMPE
jgi:hypothetical protein